MRHNAVRRVSDSTLRRALAVMLVIALAGCGPAAVTASPSPGPTKSPIPTLAAGMTRFTGKVTDASTNKPVAQVCVIIGPFPTCLENMPHTDEDGVWLADLPVASGLSWTFNFVKDGYVLATVKDVSDAPGEKRIDIALQPK